MAYMMTVIELSEGFGTNQKPKRNAVVKKEA